MVELADSLDSGSSVLYGRAGSSPASRTRKKDKVPLQRGGTLFPLPSVRQESSYRCARVVELADSLDSGSSVLYGRAGSSPASRTRKKRQAVPVFSFWCARRTVPGRYKSQITLVERRIKAFEIAVGLIDEKLGNL